MTKVYESTTIEVIFVGQGREVKFIPYPIDYRKKVDYDADYGSGKVVEFDKLTRYFNTDDESLQNEIESHPMFKIGQITCRSTANKKALDSDGLRGLGHPRLKSIVSEYTKHSPIVDEKPINSWKVDELVSFILENGIEVKE